MRGAALPALILSDYRYRILCRIRAEATRVVSSKFVLLAAGAVRNDDMPLEDNLALEEMGILGSP